MTNTLFGASSLAKDPNTYQGESIMKGNESSWDRIARAVVGVALVIAGLAAVGGAVGYILAAVGLILVVTGLVGWCPIYSVLKIGTKEDTTQASG